MDGRNGHSREAVGARCAKATASGVNRARRIPSMFMQTNPITTTAMSSVCGQRAGARITIPGSSDGQQRVAKWPFVCSERDHSAMVPFAPRNATCRAHNAIDTFINLCALLMWQLSLIQTRTIHRITAPFGKWNDAFG